jgi:hypothetical protein
MGINFMIYNLAKPYFQNNGMILVVQHPFG